MDEPDCDLRVATEVGRGWDLTCSDLAVLMTMRSLGGLLIP